LLREGTCKCPGQIPPLRGVRGLGGRDIGTKMPPPNPPQGGNLTGAYSKNLL